MKYILMEPMKFVLYRGHYHLSLSTNQLFCTSYYIRLSAFAKFTQAISLQQIGTINWKKSY